jgi:8-oxo-dGTP diphosphatase
VAARVEASPEGCPGTPALTRSYLVRHGEAGDRHAWHDADELRPLTEQGRRQAEGLVVLLADAGIDRLVSSPYVRCVQTLEPLAAARGLKVETSPVLAEGAGGRGAVELLSTDEALVACSHGDVIEEALDLLAEAGVPLEGHSSETPKGAVWALDVRDRTVVNGVFLPPPEALLNAPGKIPPA